MNTNEKVIDNLDTPKGLWLKLRNLLSGKKEIIIGNTHIINISEEEDDKFQNVNYRVYHSEGYCFDSMQVYTDSDTDDYGMTYKFFSDKFDGFKPISLSKAFEIIK